jgi:agmatine deiminase
MQWPSEVYNTGSNPVNPVIINIIKAFVPYIRVNVMVRSNSEIITVKNLLKTNGYSGTNAHFYVINHLSIWARDVGPIFVKDSKYLLNIVNFGFNNYSRGGNQAYINGEDQIAPITAQLLKLPVINSNIVIEGGAIESNGRGIMMTTESVALKRNPKMTKIQIENEFKRIFGLKKVIWLKKGLAEDDRITSGHINEIARFADSHTILLAQVLPADRYANWASKESYLRLEENYNILKNSTDQDGKPFRIVRIPMPPALYEEAGTSDKIPVRSYLNYAVTNGAVLMQTYWKTGSPTALKTVEDQVKNTFRSIFPGRNIIGIDAVNVNLWGGGIHCITQHMPAY